MAKVDTVGDNFYKPAQRGESVGEILFWFFSVLSILAFFVDRNQFPILADIIQIALIILVLLFFGQGQIQKLYLFPRAEDKRRQELLTDSFGVLLTDEQTEGYYNNDQTDPLKRLAANIMESAFFTKKLVKRTLKEIRLKTAIYIVLYFILALHRSTDLEILAIAAQALFGGEIVARWMRMEWLHARSEKVFDHSHKLFGRAADFTGKEAKSEAIEIFAFYETTKATASLMIPKRIFDKMNPKLSEDWESVRNKLGI